MEIRTLEFGGLLSALQALRLPFGKDSRSHLKTTEKEDVLFLDYMFGSDRERGIGSMPNSPQELFNHYFGSSAKSFSRGGSGGR